MHKFVRSEKPDYLDNDGSVAALKRYVNWKGFPSDKKDSIRAILSDMQAERCAYCESLISNGNNEIEHFRERDDYPQLTFAWSNLFLSCKSRTSCGLSKEGHNPNDFRYEDLIDPCKDNPEDFFVFTHEGKITPRSGLNASDEHRAKETIRIFNLESLNQTRKQFVTGFAWLQNRSSEEIDECLAELPKTPFITALYHYFGKRVS